MPTVLSQAVVPGSVERVFDFVADYRNIPRLQPHFDAVRVVSEAERGQGATVEMKGRFRNMPMRARDRIITFTPPHRIVSITEGTVTSRNTWEFAQAEGTEQQTRVSLKIEYRVGGGGLLGGLLTGVASSLIHGDLQAMTDESLVRLGEFMGKRG